MKAYWLGLMILLSMGGCPKKPTNTLTQVNKTSASNKTSPATTPGSTPTPQTPPEGKPAPKNGTIFWTSATKGNLVALACFDAEAKSFLEGDECARWVPTNSQLRDDKAALFSITPVPQGCASGKSFSGTDNSFAFWPSDTKATLLTPEKIDVKKLSATEKKAIDKEVKAKTKEKYQIDFVASLDINNDQKKERFYGVTAKKTKVTEDDTGAPFAFSGLFFADGKQPNTLILLSSSTTEQATLQGGTDLDQDGSLELWLERVLSEEDILVSRRYTLERIFENSLEEIAAREVCL